MCGIFGLIWHQSDGVPDEVRLRATAESMRHRGPDADGIFAEPSVGLVHTRLSLLDLNPRSNQPFWDKTNRYGLVFNGEIYNFAELRTELEKAGVSFRTTSDTEVLLEALLTWGPEVALPRLEGMFAFGLYDRQKRSLVLARDRFGIKPLFVYDSDEVFAFASEVQALRPWVKWEPDVLSISGFLYGFAGPTKGFSFYRGVRFIEPGAVVKVHRGATGEYGRFATLGELIDREQIEYLKNQKPEALIDQVDELLNASVKSQLVADAPVGSLCSGGLDSSIIMAIAARHHSNLAIFHANVLGPVSEYPAALRLAKHLKLDLKTAEVRDEDFIDRIPEVTWHFGHPFLSCPHSVPYLMVCRLVRSSGVKAVLSGEAADEYFLGYWFFAPELKRFWQPRKWIRNLRRGGRREAGPLIGKYAGPPYVNGGDDESSFGLVHALHNRFEIVREAAENRERLGADWNSEPYRAALPSVDSLGYNLRALLHRNDTMGMASSVEGRFPFLDTRLAKLAVNLPHDVKIRVAPGPGEDGEHQHLQNKWILRKVGERYLPSELFRRDKRPFPINAYCAERMKIAPSYFDHSFISDLFQLDRQGTQRLLRDCPHDLKFKMLLLDVWAQLCLESVPHETVLSKLHKHVSITNPTYSEFMR